MKMADVTGGTTTSAFHGLAVEGLHVALGRDNAPIVRGISFSVSSGEILGLVGESGSGKTTLAMALLGYARSGARIVGGSVKVRGEELLGLSWNDQRRLRGDVIAYVPQDPATALNPALRIGDQLSEVLAVHEPETGRSQRVARTRSLLGDVGLPSDASFLRRFPHQTSGGQQQRIVLAMAMLTRPAALILDEPTTGLDVTTQAGVLRTIRTLCKSYQVAAVYITHDLAVVAELAERVLVLYAGRMTELAATREIFERPAHPYTARLTAAIPDLFQPRLLSAIPGSPPALGHHQPGCVFAPRCQMRVTTCEEEDPIFEAVAAGHYSRCHRSTEVRPELGEMLVQAPPNPAATQALSVRDLTVSYGQVRVLDGVCLDVRSGECVALVGESGSGKTTLANAIVGLVRPDDGHVALDGRAVSPRARERTAAQRRALQYVFQNPYASLNPRHTVARIVASPLYIFQRLSRRDVDRQVAAALERVTLPRGVAEKYPDQLSGGERQRVAIARALVCDPQVLICDEVTSALDVSVQAAIVNELLALQRESAFALLFITHNIALVRSTAQRIAVMRAGQIVDDGRTDDVLTASGVSRYTKQLREDTPSLSKSRAQRGSLREHTTAAAPRYSSDSTRDLSHG